MKRLSIETLRGQSEKLPEDLRAINKGLEIFSTSIGQNLEPMLSQALVFTLEGCSKADIRPMVAKEGVYPGAMQIYSAPEKNYSFRLTADRALIYMICDLAFGGDGAEEPYVESRPLSNIERILIKKFLDIIGKTLPACFPPISTLNFIPEPPAETQSTPSPNVFRPILSAKFTCSMKAAKGEILIDLPNDLLSEVNIYVEEDKPETGPTEWTEKISSKLESIEIDLTAILAEIPLGLGVISKLSVGQIIPIGIDLKSSISVYTGDTKLRQGRLGQREGKYSLVLED